MLVVARSKDEKGKKTKLDESKILNETENCNVPFMALDEPGKQGEVHEKMKSRRGCHSVPEWRVS
jgi:hypothetical protein